jgi:hypothetical protein
MIMPIVIMNLLVGWNQGCQMVYFYTQILIWVYFLGPRYILWPFEIFSVPLVYFSASW